MKPLILAMLLPVMQTHPPVPTPVVASQVKQSQGGPKDAKEKADKQPPGPLMASVEKFCAEIAARYKKNPGSESNEQSASEWWGTNGVIAVFTGVLAFLAFLQWRAMDKQAGYMLDTLTAVKQQGQTTARQTALMAAQWVDLDNWEAYILVQCQPITLLQVAVDAVNNTSYPLTITRIAVDVNSSPSAIIGEVMPINPTGRHRWTPISFILNPEHEKLYRDGDFVLPVAGTITFTDVLGIQQPAQVFSGYVTCGEGKPTAFTRYTLASPSVSLPPEGQHT
jgi:hypothetical protein